MPITNQHSENTSISRMAATLLLQMIERGDLLVVLEAANKGLEIAGALTPKIIDETIEQTGGISSYQSRLILTAIMNPQMMEDFKNWK